VFHHKLLSLGYSNRAPVYQSDQAPSGSYYRPIVRIMAVVAPIMMTY